jgi:uncharacterized protein (TIGR02246 family)
VLATLFAADAQYTLPDGEVLRGRDAIRERTAAAFQAGSGGKLAIEVGSARLIAPDVLIEKGQATVTPKNGDPAVSLYTATHVRADGKWLIAELVETEPPAGDEDPAAAALAGLEWMLGEWKADKAGLTATTKAFWSLDGHFITRTFRIEREDGPFTGVEVIGYDPDAQGIRSWTFDSEGGFGESTWRNEANKWLIQTRATMPGGGDYSGQTVLTNLADGKAAMEITNRALDGEALPNIDRVALTRTAASAKPQP